MVMYDLMQKKNRMTYSSRKDTLRRISYKRTRYI